MVNHSQKTPQQENACYNLKTIFREFNIPTAIVGDWSANRDWSSRKIKMFAVAVLKEIGFSATQAQWIVYGIPQNIIKAEDCACLGIGKRYHSSIVNMVVDSYIARLINKDTRFNVGFDLAEFDHDAFVKQFNLTYLGKIASANSKRLHAKDPSYRLMEYNTWTDPQGNIYSTSKEKLGECNYHGFVFNDLKSAFNFAKWCIKQEDFFIKEIDLLYNGFGGLTTHDMDLYNEEKELAEMGS
jgi:hypothetical protein